MNVEQLVQSMTPEIYERLRQSVETGKWLDGSPLSEEQKDNAIQAVMLYQAKIMKSDQHMTVGAEGEIVHKSKQQLKQQFKEGEDIARFKQDDF